MPDQPTVGQTVKTPQGLSEKKPDTLGLVYNLLDFGINVHAKDVVKGFPEENPREGFRLSLGTV